jgi:Uncharacterized protein containing caspase domain
MKKILYFTVFVFLVGHLAGYAQYTINIQGSVFNIELNDQKMTATICDNNYKVDDVKFPIKNNIRMFDGFGNEHSNTVYIPETYKTIDGKVYTITTIGRAAFAGYSNMDYVVIPATVTTIGDYAFFRTSLKSVEIPATVKKMGKRVFGRCVCLESLTIPQGGVTVNRDMYAESKSVKVKTYTLTSSPADNILENPVENPIVQSTVNTAVVNKPNLIIPKVSDVDVDLPAASKQNDEMFAIIIANENYKKVAQVSCALNDGRSFYRYCQQVLGIPTDNIHLVEDATFGQMMEEFNWITHVARAYEGDARIIVYYAGHGIPNENDKTAYLLPVDVSGDNTTAAFSLNKLYASLGALNAKNVTLFMDACFSGSLRGDGMLTAARGVAIEAKAESPLGNMIVFSAAQGDETAYPYPEMGHGLFTYYLLKKLKETKGAVNLGTLGDYIRKEVGRKSIVVNNKPQTPSVSYSSKMEGSWRSITLK